MSDEERHETPHAAVGLEPATVETTGTSGRGASTTVGTGSTLGIGCLIAVILFVAAAFAARYLFGAW